MDRRVLLGGSLALIPGSLSAQIASDTDSGRIDDIEATLRNIEERLATIENKLGITTSDATPASDSTSAPSSAITISGTGPTLSEALPLEEGTYRVVVQLQQEGYFILHIHGPDGFEDFTFNEGPVSGEISGALTIPVTGDYYAEVDNTEAPWTITFSKL